MKIRYQGHIIIREEGIWKVIDEEGNIFIPALDDTKLFGKRRFNQKFNNIQSCYQYINSTER